MKPRYYIIYQEKAQTIIPKDFSANERKMNEEKNLNFETQRLGWALTISRKESIKRLEIL